MPLVENQQALVPAGPQPGGGTISLSTLIEYVVQRTYHELTVLAELLPRKTDMERKIEIVNFASRTRQLFIRLLALVKWANSASKVDKCAMISSFLDQQAMLFVETADMLAKMARETLVQARLPCFSLPSAIDVLTTGTFPRLPTCIKERIVPADAITPVEKRQTLVRLNQIIEHRLVTSDLPPLMQRLRIENGRVKFHVEHEFQVSLTLMGDGPNIPWRLLDIEFLVEDPDTGDGKALVHSLQVNYIHRLVQSRLLENEKPLHDLYKCLHSFCQSLQLEVLHSQTQRLIHQRLGDAIRTEEYTAGKSLVISYWRDTGRREGRNIPAQTYKLSIHVDEAEPCKPLQISHFPQIQGSESTKVAQAIRSDHLSIEKLLVHTIQVRSTAKLKELERELRCIVPGPCEIRDLPSVLFVPIIYPCMTSEKLCISVNIQKGTFLASLNEKENDLTADIEDILNTDHRDLQQLLANLRLWIAVHRLKESIQHFHVPCFEELPFTSLEGHPLEKLHTHKVFVQLAKHHNFYLVVEVFENSPRSVDYSFYLLQVSPTSFDSSPEETLEQPPKVYLKASHMMKLDTYACTHGPGAKIHDIEIEESNPMHRKRKLLLGDPYEPQSKKTKVSPYFVPELTHIMALCEDRIPFIALGEELLRHGMPHQGIQVDDDCTGLCLALIGAPPCPALEKAKADVLAGDLLSCKFRIQRKIWLVESIFTNCPVKSTNPREQGPLHRVYFQHDLGGSETIEKNVDSFLNDWNSVAHLYSALLDFANVYNGDSTFQSSIEVRTFTYKRLTLGYGPNKCYTVSIQYRTSDNQFHLSFGTSGQSTMANCHTLVATLLQKQLNDTKSIALLAQTLLDTWSPLTSIGKLSTTPMLGLYTRPNQPVPGFTIIPQSPCHIRVTFRSTHCIDIHCRANRVVAVRDGAFSMFETSKVVEGLNPTQGLKAFLNLYVDDLTSGSHLRRRSTTEDDNPPSPIGMDNMDTFMSQHSNTGSPSSRGKQDGLRFHNPMTPPSNPHTPASPASRMNQPHHSASPAAATNFLASPPSLGTVGPSPSASLMSNPSPGTMLSQNSPGNPALHVPSPSSFVPAPSPGSLGIHMSPATQFISPQGMVEGGGSPFPSSSLAMPSPGARNWPASPSMPGPSPASRHGTAHSPGHPALHSPQTHGVMSPPSRMLPQRSWAASIPTLLSHDALNKLLMPSLLPGTSGGPSSVPCCPLERFLCCVNLRRHTQRVVSSDENSLQVVQSNEPGVILFKVESLQFRVSLNPTTLQSLHLKASPLVPESDQWTKEELQILEKFFEMKVACPPYAANTLTAFGRLLGAPLRILKDFIQIMKLEVMPEHNLKWSVQWCLTMPHSGPNIAVPGTPAVVVKGKILFMLQLTRTMPVSTPNSDMQVIIIPILYDMTTNVTQMAEQRQPNTPPPSQADMAVKTMLKRFCDFHSKPAGDCTMYPAVRELLTNLVVPV